MGAGAHMLNRRGLKVVKGDIVLRRADNREKVSGNLIERNLADCKATG